jgi:hypothetical protein
VGTDTLIYGGEGVYPSAEAGAGSTVCLDGKLSDLPNTYISGTNNLNLSNNNITVFADDARGIKILCAVCVR